MIPAAARKSGDPALVNARVAALDADGRGIADHVPRPLRIEGALEGEGVRVEILRRRRRFDEARLVEILDPSAHRVTPACDFFDLCGGCRLQHLHIDMQRSGKEDALRSALEAQAVSAPGEFVEPIVGADLHYRRKARLGVKHVPGKGGAMVGFREKRGRLIADIRRCEVLRPEVGARIQSLRDLVSGLDARDRIPQIEVAAGDDAVALVFRHLDPLSASDLDALRGFARDNALAVFLQPGSADSVVPLEPGEETSLSYRLPEFELELEFSPLDFVQVNAEVNRKLVSRAVEWLGAGPADRVLDLFCGIGNFTLALARHAGEVTGVEVSVDMVAAARRNAAKNAIGNAGFEVTDLEQADAVDTLLSRGFTHLILDPPRSGAGAVVTRLADPYPRRIVYVSCSAASFARDAAVLTNTHGYRLERAGIVDMFPHTAHCEMIGCFARALP